MGRYLPALAFLAALGNPADDFIDECSKAVLGIKEGEWNWSGVGDDGNPYKVEVFRKSDLSRMRQTSGDAVLYDTVSGPTSTVVVYSAERKVLVQKYPVRSGEEKPEPLPPLAEGEFKFNVDTRSRISPALQSRLPV